MAPFREADATIRSDLRASSSSRECLRPPAPPPQPIPPQPTVPPSSAPQPQPPREEPPAPTSAASSAQAPSAPASCFGAASASLQPPPFLAPRPLVPLAPFPFVTRVPGTYRANAPQHQSVLMNESVATGGGLGYYRVMHQHSHSQPQAQAPTRKRKATWNHACQTCGHLVKVMKEFHKKKRDGSSSSKRCTFEIPEGIVVPPPNDSNRGKCRYPGCTECALRIQQV
jgi:hypothetical protein